MLKRTLILCPLKLEVQLLLSALQELGFKTRSQSHQGRSFYFVEGTDWIVGTGGLGKVSFALRTWQALDVFSEVRLVLCVGSAGAISSDLASEDIIVGTQSIEHDYKSSLVSQPPTYKTSSSLLDKIKPRTEDFQNVHFAGIASGDEDVLSQARALEIHQSTGALAVAWEGAGGARACQMRNIDYGEVRVITDHANSQTFADFKQHLKPGMQVLALWLSTALA